MIHSTMKQASIYLLLSLALIACKGTDATTPSVQNAPDETYNALFTFKNGVIGSSISHSLALPDGRTLWLFSDGFIGTANDDRSTSVDKITAVRNAGVIQADKLFTTLNATEQGKAKNLVDATAPGDYLSLAGGAVSGGNIEILTHEFNITQRFLKLNLVTFSFPALKFISLVELKNPIGITYGDYIYSDNNYHYIFGRETRGTDMKIHVARATLGKLGNQALWQYYNGSEYGNDATKSVAIFNTSARQFSVVKINEQFKIVLQKDKNVIAYTAPVLVGPYDAGKTLFSITDSNPTSNAFVHTQFTTKDGQYLLSYDVQNLGTQNQNFLKNVDLFRPKFYRHNLQ